MNVRGDDHRVGMAGGYFGEPFRGFDGSCTSDDKPCAGPNEGIDLFRGANATTDLYFHGRFPDDLIDNGGV